jgi:hypothetical protein
MTERDEKKELKKRVNNLETALADAHIDCSLDRAFLEIACERLGINIDEFKKKRIDAIGRAKIEGAEIGKFRITKLCERAGMTRQNYYKAKKRRKACELDSEFIVSSVQEIRCEQPRLGGRKLLKLLGKELDEAGIQVGRDRFFETRTS